MNSPIPSQIYMFLTTYSELKLLLYCFWYLPDADASFHNLAKAPLTPRQLIAQVNLFVLRHDELQDSIGRSQFTAEQWTIRRIARTSR